MQALLLILSVLSGYLEWSDRRLTESDFVVSYTMKDGELANVTTGMYMSEGKAIAICDPSQSFISYKAPRQLIPYILAHEQLHFDISEYNTRQLNKQLKKYPTVNKDSLFNVYIAKKDSMQSLYDYETQHSQDTVQQKQWSIKLKQLLYGNN